MGAQRGSGLWVCDAFAVALVEPCDRFKLHAELNRNVMRRLLAPPRWRADNVVHLALAFLDSFHQPHPR